MIGSIKEKWRVLSGNDNWKDLLDPLDIDLRRYIIHYGERARQPMMHSIEVRRQSMLGIVNLEGKISSPEWVNTKAIHLSTRPPSSFTRRLVFHFPPYLFSSHYPGSVGTRNQTGSGTLPLLPMKERLHWAGGTC